MILVDTSVWIDLLRNVPSAEAITLARLIEDREDVAICGVIRQEVLQGIKDDVMSERIRRLLGEAHYFSLTEPKSFDDAATIYRRLKRNGFTIRSPIDCLIAAIAIENKTPLFHKDRDFAAIARHTHLTLYRI